MSIIEPHSDGPPQGVDKIGKSWPTSPSVSEPLPDETALLGKRSALVFDQKLVAFIVLAAFITSFAQPGSIGGIPLQILILKKMHLGATKFAEYGFISAAAWYFKPLAGLVMDAFPLLGTRRKSYMTIASLISTGLWILLGYSSSSYPVLLYASVALNVFMMIASTGMGGLLVEYGQNKAATGGLSAARETVTNIGGIFTGVTGGWLATKAFSVTGYAGAAFMAILLFGAMFLLHEGKTEIDAKNVWRQAGSQIRTILTSKTLWCAALMMTLIFVAPGFGALLADRQVNVLNFKPTQLGFLGSASAVTGVIGAVLYGFICRYMDLRKLLVWGILLNVASTLIYLFYSNYDRALIIDPANGIMSELAILPVYDLAARATPKGCEGMGFALMMAVRNLALGGSNWAGAQFATSHHIPFDTMVWANAIFTFLVLILVPLVPGVLVRNKDGAKAVAPQPAPG